MIWGWNRKCKVYKIPSNPVVFCGIWTILPPIMWTTHPPLKTRQRARLALNKVLSTWPNFVQNNFILGKNPTGPHIEDRLLNDNLKETSKPGRGSSMAEKTRLSFAKKFKLQNLYDGDQEHEKGNPRTIFIGNLGNRSYRGNHDHDCQCHKKRDWVYILQNLTQFQKPPHCVHDATQKLLIWKSKMWHWEIFWWNCSQSKATHHNKNSSSGRKRDVRTLLNHFWIKNVKNRAVKIVSIRC